ncbi:DHBP synthase RibB-like alpha/beta domain isoform 1 [Hibiscus syriacus]|uniref:DHBP synthase RibB-like alpha/beta domain isoform 1 n=1 Tax=Hibiscus syriacus TaxID=106335 RepID=A0A6A2X5H9_HIBSY|nr:DHBP synthase RibB-like alpha/beta domain isoform 1 [Hibiscus syriacus]
MCVSKMSKTYLSLFYESKALCLEMLQLSEVFSLMFPDTGFGTRSLFFFSSACCRFCFLEQFLMRKMGISAIAVALPCSCVLGLLSSMVSSTMVSRRFVWLYALIQFVLVVAFAHIFYSTVKIQAILSILLAMFSGFGVTMSGSSFVSEIIRCRRRRQRAQQQHSSARMDPNNVNQQSADSVGGGS